MPTCERSRHSVGRLRTLIRPRREVIDGLEQTHLVKRPAFARLKCKHECSVLCVGYCDRKSLTQKCVAFAPVA